MYKHNAHSVVILSVCSAGTTLTVAKHNRDHYLCSTGTTVIKYSHLVIRLERPQAVCKAAGNRRLV